MNRTGNGIVLCEDPHDFLVMQNLYDAAVRQLTLKFNILNSEFNVLYARNPIHHIDGRVKSQSSIVAQLVKKELPVSIESARDIKVPVYLSNRTEYVGAEIQIRTIAMDFWASLEHDIRYKVDKTKLPEGINEEMFECAGKIAEIDRQMQDMYQRIKASDAYNED